MTLIDKAKSFLGGHGVTVRHVSIEGAAPSAARLALPDGGVKGVFAVSAEKPCEVRGRRTQLVMELSHADGRLEQVVLGGDEARPPATGARRDGDGGSDGDGDGEAAAPPVHAAPGSDRAAAPPVVYPYELAAGFTVEDTFDVVFDGSIEAILALRRLSAGDGVRLFLRTVVDVAGSPFDPEAVDEVALAT